MSMTTFFQFTEISYLPLPPTRASQTPQALSPVSTNSSTTGPSLPTPETSDDIIARGLTTALSMLHSPELMIALNPLVQHYTRISPTDPSQSAQLVDLPRLAPEFNVTLSHPHPNCHTFPQSETGEFVHYEILDKFSMLFGSVNKLMTYKACFRPLYPDGSMETQTLNSPSQMRAPDSPSAPKSTSIGLETISDPGSGVALLAKWTLSLDPTRPHSITLTESVKVHCSFWLGWYVRSQLETAHGALHKEFGMRFVRAMIEGDPMRGRDARVGKSWGEVRREGTVRSVRAGGAVGGGREGEVGRGVERGFGNASASIGGSGKEGEMGGARGFERQWSGDAESRRKSEWDREEPVSAIGDDDMSSVGFGRPRALKRTGTNDSAVSEMR